MYFFLYFFNSSSFIIFMIFKSLIVRILDDSFNIDSFNIEMFTFLANFFSDIRYYEKYNQQSNGIIFVTFFFYNLYILLIF